MVAILKSILDLFKEPVRYAVALGVVAVITLFSPDWFINMLGLMKYREEGKPYLGGLLLLCFAVVVAAGFDFAVKKYKDYRLSRARKERLQGLTVEEKQILRGYIKSQTRSMDLPVKSGVVQGLVAVGVIWRSSNFIDFETEIPTCAYNVHQWAWDHLNQHRDLLR